MRIFPWNYTLPDLKDYMNSSDLPSAHDLLGITTTTTEVSYVNKPIFPLNITAWNVLNMPWRINFTGQDEDETFTSTSSRQIGYDSRSSHDYSSGYDVGNWADENRRGTAAFAYGASEGVAQMVLPTSLGTMVQDPSFGSMLNSSLLNNDHSWVLYDNRSDVNGTDLGNVGEHRAGMSTAGMIITSVILGIMILTTVIGENFFRVSRCIVLLSKFVASFRNFFFL